MSGFSPASCWIAHKRLESWARAAKERALGSTSPKHKCIQDSNGSNSNSSNNSLEEVNVVRDLVTAYPQPPHFSADSYRPDGPSGSNQQALSHQSRSYPVGHPHLCITPSVSSQSSIEGATPKQDYRGPSPQIRTFGPDGIAPVINCEPQYGPRSLSRSPSPLRAVSINTDCISPFTMVANVCTNSHLQTLSRSDRICSSPRMHGRCSSPSPIDGSETIRETALNAPPASPLGAIQPDLYLKRDGPVFIKCTPKDGIFLGRLHFRVMYDFDKSDLVIHLIEAHDLTGSENDGFSNPYVQVSIIPEVDSRKRQSSVHRNDCNPFYNEHFKFPVSYNELQDKSLLFQVFDYDRYSQIVGEVNVAISDLDISANIEVWGDVTKSKNLSENLPEVLVSLNHLGSAGRLTVNVMEARNLKSPTGKEHIDSFIKVYLVVNGKRVKKKKTSTRKGTCSLIWNESLVFDLPDGCLEFAAVEICIMEQTGDLRGHHPLIGCCLIGPNESGPEKDHWLDMVQNSSPVVCWHVTR